MKKVFSGIEGMGKSLKLAMVAADIVQRNHKWYRITGIERKIFSNLKFSSEFEAYAKSKNVPIVYWKNLDELIEVEQSDVIIDEIGNYFDSRQWQDLSLDVRRWITQGSKCGIEIYASAQDFAQVDKSFRRLVNELTEVKKIIGSPRPAATKPPVKKIWGVCMTRELDPRAYNEDKKKFASQFHIPKFFVIQKKFCEIFDTTQKIVRSEIPPLRHEVRMCQHHKNAGGSGECDFCKVIHV